MKYKVETVEKARQHAVTVTNTLFTYSLQFLRYDARQRIDAAAALRHDFFAHLPPEVRQLPDAESIFTVKGVRLAKDPGGKSLGAMTAGLSGNKRRQSMLF